MYEPGSGPSPDSESVGALIFNFLTFRTVRNKYLLLVSHTVYFIISAQMDQDIVVSKIHAVALCALEMWASAMKF